MSWEAEAEVLLCLSRRRRAAEAMLPTRSSAELSMATVENIKKPSRDTTTMALMLAELRQTSSRIRPALAKQGEAADLHSREKSIAVTWVVDVSLFGKVGAQSTGMPVSCCI